ncbi:MAG: DVUA0089 family protein [Planctomycetota bacterium]|nr:DVUA0089 family protein [Planctomycetota bacterium]
MKNVLAIAALVAVAGSANAQVFNEIGDATDTPPGQSVTNGTTSIMGTNMGADADVYGFSWGGGSLTIDSFGGADGFDTQLHLFDGNGNGIGENDDSSNGGTGLESQISLNLAAGIYLIGITEFNNDAQDAGGNDIFGFTNTYLDDLGNFIQGLEGGGALAQWDGSSFGSGGRYVINFSSPVNAVPAPGAMALLGLGGIAAIRRRR